MRKTKAVSVSLSLETYDVLSRIAKENNVSVGYIVKLLVEKYRWEIEGMVLMDNLEEILKKIEAEQWKGIEKERCY